MQPESLLLPAHGFVPNNPALPVLLWDCPVSVDGQGAWLSGVSVDD